MKNGLIVWTLSLATLAALALSACGGHTLDIGSTDGGSGASSGGSSSDGMSGSSNVSTPPSSSGGSTNDDGSTPPLLTTDGGTPNAPEESCPSTPPANGSSCSNEALECQYGDDPNLTCDTLALCQQQGQAQVWVTTAAATGGLCPTSLPGKAGCPSTYPTAGQTCTMDSSGGPSCAYPQGLCACTAPSAYQPGYEWQCETPGAYCPEPRPGVGTSCSGNNLTCAYGVCPDDGVETLTCLDGEQWTVSAGQCGE